VALSAPQISQAFTRKIAGPSPAILFCVRLIRRRSGELPALLAFGIRWRFAGLTGSTSAGGGTSATFATALTAHGVVS
jgi:hypothetical protein